MKLLLYCALQVALTTRSSSSSTCTAQAEHQSASALEGMFRVAIAEHSKLSWASGGISHLSQEDNKTDWNPACKGFSQSLLASTMASDRLCRMPRERYIYTAEQSNDICIMMSVIYTSQNNQCP